MNPKEFWWTEDQTVTVTNPTPEDFNFKVHNKDYMIGAGQTAKNVPGFVAWVYVYGQGFKAAMTDGKSDSWNEEGFRRQYFEKFVAGVDASFEIVQEDSEPAIRTFDSPSASTEEPTELEAPKRGRPATKV